MKTIGIIPARYYSSRLPGKPLIEITGKPMLLLVYERVQSAKGLDAIYVATEDDRIASLCEQNHIPVIKTSAEHLTAASRLWEASETVSADFYIQINGDEPFIDLDAISAAVPEAVPKDREFGTNIVTEIEDPIQLMDSSNIKVVFDEAYRMLYMSRTPIPYPNKALDFHYYKHVGVIGYNKKMLDFYHESSPGRLERIEGIDTLRFLDYGKELLAVPLSGLKTISVDTPKDLFLVRKMMENANASG